MALWMSITSLQKKEKPMKRFALFSTVLIGALFLLSIPSQAQNENKMQQAGPKIVELKLGTDVQNKEIVGEDSTFAVNAKVYAWMKITGAMGDSIVVYWKHADKDYKTTIGIGGNSWRVWAYKTVSAAGDWTISVSIQAGEVLKDASFTVK